MAVGKEPRPLKNEAPSPGAAVEAQME